MPNTPYGRVLSTPATQTEKARPDQVLNNAGGFVFAVSDKTRLERFLILGTDGGTYYTSEKQLTKENVDFLVELIARDEALVESTVRVISTSGRAYRNSAAIFAVAALFQYGKNKDYSLVTDVCRTSTHLFEFIEYIKLLGGFGRAKRSAVANWYTSKSVDDLAYQVIKYRQRNGYTHRDAIRLSHPVGLNKKLGDFILGKETEETYPLPLIRGFKLAQTATTFAELKPILTEYNIPWEAVPTSFHKELDLWKTLFYNGQLRGQALLRNITRLSKLDAFKDMVFTRDVANKLLDEEMIRKTKLHPIQYLLALTVHTKGQVDRKSYWSARTKTWTSSPVITEALNDGFYAAFEYVEPANKRTMIALDVSGSMSSPALGLDLSCAELAAAISMTVALKEPYYQIMGFANTFRDLGINPSMSLTEIVDKTSSMNFGTTDCGLPMVYALENRIEVNTFIVLTDNETYAGRVHPYRALNDYRQRMGINARLIVAGFTSTGFSIADPNDAGMLDIVGADSNLPRLVSDFSAGRI